MPGAKTVVFALDDAVRGAPAMVVRVVVGRFVADPGVEPAAGLAGRDFTANDTLTSPTVVIVNETFAQKYFPGVNPIGRRIRNDPNPGTPVPTTGLNRTLVVTRSRISCMASSGRADISKFSWI